MDRIHLWKMRFFGGRDVEVEYVRFGVDVAEQHG